MHQDEPTTKRGSRVRGLGLGLLIAAVGAFGCTRSTNPPAEKPPGPALPITEGNYDCAAPATWTTTTFAALVPSVQSALAKENPQVALDDLLFAHFDQEVTCVAAYIHAESAKQEETATDAALAHQRVVATESWISRQAARHVTVTNYGGEVH